MKNIGTKNNDYVSEVDKYDELNNNGKSRLDAMAEFTTTMAGGKAVPTIQSLEGKDQYLFVEMFYIFKKIKDDPSDKNSVAALNMLLRGKGKLMDIEESARELLSKFQNSNISFQMDDYLREAIEAFLA